MPTPNESNADEQKRLKAAAEDASNVSLSFIPGLDKAIEGLKKVQIGFGNNLGDITNSLRSTVEFTETQVSSISRMFAGSKLLAQDARNLYRDATPSVVALGGSINDVYKIQKSVLTNLQTQAILNTDAYKEVYSAGALITKSGEDAGQKAAELIPMFANAGYGINNIGKEMLGILNTAKELGVTSQATFDNIKGSIEKINLYNFENGIQSMSHMAAQASLLRISMSDTLKIADTLFDPQKAVDMSTALQRLGVNNAALLDPYKLMDMSRNNPEKLQESIGEALKSLTFFDEKSQKMRILPGAQTHLREIAKELGLADEKVASWAINSGDLGRKMKEIRFSSDFATKEDRQMIAGMAQLGKAGGQFEGKYVVTIGGNEKLVSELSSVDRKAIEESNKPSDRIENIQLAANGIYNNTKNLANVSKGAVERTIAADPAFGEGLSKISRVLSTGYETFNSLIGIHRKAVDDNSLEVKIITKNVASVTKTINDAFTKGVNGDIGGMVKTIETGFTKLGDIFVNNLKQNLGTESKKASDRFNTNTEIRSIIQNFPGLPQEQKDKLLQSFSSTNTNINNTNNNNNGDINVSGVIKIDVGTKEIEPLMLSMLESAKVGDAISNVVTRNNNTQDILKGGANGASKQNLTFIS